MTKHALEEIQRSLEPSVDAAPVLDLRSATRRFRYGDGCVTALDAVDLVVAPGQYLAVTGRSGSGKSTLLNVLGLLDSPSEGRYSVGGVDTAALSPKGLDMLRGEVFGLVFQAFHLLEYLTVAENIALGLTYEGISRAEKDLLVASAIHSVSLEHRADARARTLSGGERQRTAIARTLVRRPSVLLADEPTGNLDQANAEIVLALFDSVHRAGVSVVVVTHDGETAERADRRVHMRDGRIDGVS